MNTVEYIKEQFEQLQSKNGKSGLESLRKKGFDTFNKFGIPTLRNEEWKYTRISGLFNKEYQFAKPNITGVPGSDVLNTFRLPGHEEANELVFVNGLFSPALSVIRSRELIVLTLEEAATNQYKGVVAKYLGHSSDYLKDGINALSTAFLQEGVFINVGKGKIAEHPVYIYNITDASAGNILSQPRSLVHIEENAQVQMVEIYNTIGSDDCFLNQVMEIVVEKDARVEYYKIQSDADNCNQVSTTHIRQTGKSYVNTVTISLNGGLVRNNLNIVMEAEYCESHMYGLYFPKGQGLIDNHTVVDNVKPNCLSNELYKGLMDGQTTGVFNGKIFVRQDAQKTNAYQSNRNILLSDSASVNAKPQLEIFADDVKCSHGCTVGRLDEEGLFYLQSRGIPVKIARSLLLHSFVADILDQVKLPLVREYIDQLISERLEFELP
jgi:Fe-S cluster assembly protein SufD